MVERLRNANDPLEKMERLTVLLSAIDKDRFLSGKLALHGGTAINAFIFDLPRMSVDVDLSYVVDIPYNELPSEREKVLEAVRKVAGDLGYKPSYGKAEHAGRTIRLHYAEGEGEIKADINFMSRVPVFEPVRYKSCLDPSMSFPILSPYDVFGGKVRAVLGRAKARDLYDISTIARRTQDFDSKLLHGTLLFYATLSDLFPQRFESSFSDGLSTRFAHATAAEDIKQNLIPVLSSNVQTPSTEELIENAKQFLREWVDPQNDREQEYVERIKQADFAPELILPANAAERAKRMPMARWKLKNLEKYVELPPYQESAE